MERWIKYEVVSDEERKNEKKERERKQGRYFFCVFVHQKGFLGCSSRWGVGKRYRVGRKTRKRMKRITKITWE
jgi:hypothetical protein